MVPAEMLSGVLDENAVPVARCRMLAPMVTMLESCTAAVLASRRVPPLMVVAPV